MANRYDQRTTQFSPEGRLLQVEYAMESINNAGTVVGVLSPLEGVVLAAERKVVSKLLEPSKVSEKMFILDEHIICAVGGLFADANYLIEFARRVSQSYSLTYQEPMPVESLIQRICDRKQGQTQFGGQRPFGVSFVYAGYDKHFGYQLYTSDPSGNYSGWKATAIGANNQTATSLLKQEYVENCNLNQALALAAKVLCKTMDTTTISPEKCKSLMQWSLKFLQRHPMTQLLVVRYLIKRQKQF